MNAILVIDTGSSSMRGILFSPEGKILHREQRKYFMRVEESGIAEQSPAQYAEALLEICTACGKQAASQNTRIRALSFTSQRSSILPLDRAGQPLCDIITWYDKRSVAICEEKIRIFGDEIYAIAGMKPTPVLSAPKMLWLRRTNPQLYDKAEKIVGIHDYLLYLCTGRLVTDATLASRTCLMDSRTLQWSDRLLEIFELDRSKLCTLLVPGSAIGCISAEFARQTGLSADTEVISAGGDQQCSVLGQGLLRPGMAGVTVGTGAYLAAICDQPYFDPKQRVNLNAAVTPGHWVLEASTLSSGAVYDWFNRLFYTESGQSYPMELIDREVSGSPAGARGVLALPDLAGKGCPDWDDWAHGTFYNLDFSSTRGDIARALLEGIAAEIAECHAVLREIDSRIMNISVTGGLAKFGKFVQILADMIEFSIDRCTIEETTAIGAYLAASAALGWAESIEEACNKFLHDQPEPIRFDPNPANTAVYRRVNQARRLLSNALPNQQLTQLLRAAQS